MANSRLGRYVKYLRNKEGLDRTIWTASVHFATPVATETAAVVLPFDAELVAACASVSSTGTVGGSTEITIDNTTQSVTDLDAGQLDIAYNDADGVTSVDALSSTPLIPVNGFNGDVYTVTIDAIPNGAASADLNVVLTFATL